MRSLEGEFDAPSLASSLHNSGEHSLMLCIQSPRGHERNIHLSVGVAAQAQMQTRSQAQ